MNETEKVNKNHPLHHKQWLKPFFIYTVIFIGIALFMITLFKKYNKGFIWSVDGVAQHIINLRYFRELLVNFIRTGEISTFTWNVGLGFELFGNLAYYIIGDFFSYLSVLVTTSKVEILYSVLVIIRIYFVGIGFLCYCKYKKMKPFASIVGALMYTFCSFVLFAAVRHPYFANAVILFPLLLIGIEKIIIDNKPIYYCIMITIMFMMNFYFAYMIAIIIAIYGVILAIYTYRDDGIKKIVKVLLKTLFYSILGIVISGIFLFPTAITFITSERSGSGTIYPYSVGHYRNLASSLLSIREVSYWVYIGVQSIILISLPIFIRKRKQNWPIFILFVVLILPLLVSQIGSVICGFAYPNNRWTFGLAFIFSFMTTKMIHDNEKIDKKNLIAIGIFSFIYLCIHIISEVGIGIYTEIQFGVAVLLLVLMMNQDKLKSKFKKVNLYYTLFIFVLVIGIFSSIKYRYDVDGENYVSQFLDNNELNEVIATSNYQIENFNKAVKYIRKKDQGFYKVSKYPYTYQTANFPLMNKKYQSIGHYYSITPNLHGKLNTDLGNLQYHVSEGCMEFDYRTKITTLLGVKYCIVQENEEIQPIPIMPTIPYGYSKMKTYKGIGKTKIYKNNYSLPFGVLYSSYITEDEYEKLTSLEKESSLLKTTMLSNDAISKSKSNMRHHEINSDDNNIKEVAYEREDTKLYIEQKKGVTIEDIKDNSIQLNIGTIKNSEIYVTFEGLEYQPYTTEELVELESRPTNSIAQSLKVENPKIQEEKVKYKYKWYQPNYGYDVTAKYKNISKTKTIKDYVTYPYYLEEDEILFNMGYYYETDGVITIQFSKIGNYQWDSLKVYAVSMSDYEKDIEDLRKSNFEVISYGNGYLKGKTNAETDGILQFSTIYNKGWKIYVDGKEVNTLVSNKYFLGIPISKGEHEINMEYTTPYLKEGAIISGIGIIVLIGCIIFNKRKDKSLKQNKEKA